MLRIVHNLGTRAESSGSWYPLPEKTERRDSTPNLNIGAGTHVSKQSFRVFSSLASSVEMW